MPDLLTMFGVMMMGMAMGAFLTTLQFRGQLRRLHEQQANMSYSGPRLVEPLSRRVAAPNLKVS